MGEPEALVQIVSAILKEIVYLSVFTRAHHKDISVWAAKEITPHSKGTSRHFLKVNRTKDSYWPLTPVDIITMKVKIFLSKAKFWSRAMKYLQVMNYSCQKASHHFLWWLVKSKDQRKIIECFHRLEFQFAKTSLTTFPYYFEKVENRS